MDNDQGNNNGGAPADDANDDAEWAAALDSYSKDRGVEPGAPSNDEDKGGAGNEQTPEEKKAAEDKAAADKKVEDDAAAKKAADEAEAEKAKNETPEQTEARHKTEKEAADKKAAEQPVVDNPRIRETRQTQRELARQEQEMKEDIRKELFSDVQTQLLDSDGDPIETIEDVQKLKNPNTGKAFTEDEAAAWLLKAQQNIAKTNQETEAKVERIASVNLDLMDQADAVKAKYGALLKSMPDIAKEIVTEFNASLKTDPKTGYILEAPLNMEKFFDLALKPYALQAQQLQALDKQERDRIAKEEAEKKENKKKQTRQDRSDIYGGGKVETMDDEEKEWADAAKRYYGNK